MDVFDFIIVGGGASGSILAYRLAKLLPNHSVLLLEAGGDNADEKYRTFRERYFALMTPGYNWGYKTIPQSNLKDREIDYSRGKGLGGSSAINFCVYTRGSKADYDHWAELVGDEQWKWDRALERFKGIEHFHQPPAEYEKFVHGSEANHGFRGEIDVEAIAGWDPTLEQFLEAAYASYPQNLDHNSGNPLGVGICQNSTRDGLRSTAAEVMLKSRPDNLTVRTDATVSKIVFDNKKATGVEIGTELIPANKDIILSGGAIDTPKLLHLSGIGPASELQDLHIPVIHDLPGVGKNLCDRLFLELVTAQKPGSHHRTSYVGSPEKFEEARKQWQTDKTGPLAEYLLPQMIAFVKSGRINKSKEFEDLDSETKKLLSLETKPAFEMISQNPSTSAKDPEHYLATAIAFPSTQSGKGSVRLRSNNPADPPVIDPDFLAHPFDQRLAIEALRETIQFLDTPSLSKDRLRWIACPKGPSDEDIFDYISEKSTSMWHACGTVKMGKPDDPTACVDTDFKIRGLEGIRVADTSVAPFLPSAHLQAPAYLIGVMAAEKLRKDHAGVS